MANRETTSPSSGYSPPGSYSSDVAERGSNISTLSFNNLSKCEGRPARSLKPPTASGSMLATWVYETHRERLPVTERLQAGMAFPR
ncbi:hypothetical protein OQA88_10639 [Cercophora sp. LCS_1]